MSLFPWSQEAGRPSLPQQDLPNPSRRIKILTSPLCEPVTAQDLADVVKVSTQDEGALLTGLLIGARAWCEAYTGRIFVTTQLQVFLDSFPLDRQILLPGAPAQSVASMSWFDDNDTETVMDPSTSGDYMVDLVNEPARVVLRHGISAPTDLRVANGLQVTYTAGYGDTAIAVPDGIKNAIKFLAGEFYLNRGAQVDNPQIALNSVVPRDVMLMLETFKVWR